MGCSGASRGRRSTPGGRCVVVEDVVTTGGSTLAAIEALHEAGHEICGVVSVLDRLAGGGGGDRSARRAPPTWRSRRSTTSTPTAPTAGRLSVMAPARRRRSRSVPPARGRGVLLELFGELAEYEQLEHEMRATEERLTRRCSASGRRPRR